MTCCAPEYLISQLLTGGQISCRATKSAQLYIELRQYGGQSCCFEWLEDHKVGIFLKQSVSKRLKKSKKFAFRNSPFTRQHNISLNGTKSKIFDRVSRKVLSTT